MALSRVDNVSLRAMHTVLPATVVSNTDLPGHTRDELMRIVSSTGIRQRHVVSEEQTALDLGKVAATKLLQQASIDIADVGLVIFVTQTPDFPFPGNAVQLQNALGASKECVAFDVNLGCSGFVYGLWQAGQLLNTIPQAYALLLCGDTTSKQCNIDNPKVNALFGDAVSAVLLKKQDTAPSWFFQLGSDGSGAPYLAQAAGGQRYPNQALDLQMDGTQVFAFTLREVPKSIQQCLQHAQLNITDIDSVVMHQANAMMLKHLADKLNITAEQLVLELSEVGNTSSASIPLAMCSHENENIAKLEHTVLMSGFGVGWSWASAIIRYNPAIPMDISII